eukprot:m.59231 g.59231  ORF g.59231 m.59231 type:complete len:79 (+) comp9452_c0_seq1:1413-1649(+)
MSGTVSAVFIHWLRPREQIYDSILVLLLGTEELHGPVELEVGAQGYQPPFQWPTTRQPRELPEQRPTCPTSFGAAAGY